MAKKTALVQGNQACAEGAIYAGCTFFGGYPITPSTEVAEELSELLPTVGGKFIQMEDEIGAMASVIGASLTGAKALTATSGPGVSLKQELIGYACIAETPCVIVNVMRGGPSTGMPTGPGQSDVMQARWGTHGDHPIIALTPASVQEAFDLTVRAFNLAEKYRTPVILLADGIIGHAKERLEVPETVETVDRKVATADDEVLFGDSEVAPMPQFGEGLSAHVTGSTHEPDGMRDVSTREVHDALVRGFHEKIEGNREDIVEYETRWTDDMDELVVAYGITGRIAEGALKQLQGEGERIGLLRPTTLWPFPEDVVADLSTEVERIYVPEMNLGQVSREVERVAEAPVELIDRIGGDPFTVQELADHIGGDRA